MDATGEITIKELFGKIGSTLRYILSRWLIVLIFSILGGVAGLAYALLKKPTYTAVTTFVLEDGLNGGSLAQYAGLASLAGVDLNTSGDGLVPSDNILELYKSRLMIEKTLLSYATFGNRQEMLIDRYMEINNLNMDGNTVDHSNKISFQGDPHRFNRTQDSIIFDIVKALNKKGLTVKKPDKKLSIISVGVASKDELFSLEFNKKLVETVNNFYIITKTKKSYQNVAMLQHQADSVRLVINSPMGGAVPAINVTSPAKPTLPVVKIPSQNRQLDIQASSAVYAEIVKNLEISMISLRQDIPLIQMIDEPRLPLDNNRMSKVKGIVEGFFIAGFIAVFFMSLKRMFSSM